MPITPLHLGPALILCRASNRLGCGPLIAGSVLVDIEPGIVILTGINARLHGPLHTFVAAILIGWIAGILGELAWSRLGLPGQARERKFAMISGIIAWAFHVALDSPLYSDITPLQPFFQSNPLYIVLGIYTVTAVYILSAVLTIIGLLLFFSKYDYTSSNLWGRTR